MMYLLVWILAQVGAPAGADRPIVAVFDVEDRGAGLTPEELSNLTEYLASLLAESAYQVVPRDQIRARLRQQAVDSYKECFDQGCQIELGREVAAQKSLATKVLKIGSRCQVSSNLYDLKRSTAELAANAEADCTGDALMQAVKTVSLKLCAALTGAQAYGTEAAEWAARKQAEEAAAKEAKDRRTRGLARPLTLTNLRLVTALDIAIPATFGKVDWIDDVGGADRQEYYAMGVAVAFELAFEDWSLGASLSVAANEPSKIHYDKSTNMVVGNPSLFFTMRYCREAGWDFCFGTATTVSAGFWSWTNSGPVPSSEPRGTANLNPEMEYLSHQTGQAMYQDPIAHLFQRLGVSPLGVVTARTGSLALESQLGFVLSVPLVEAKDWGIIESTKPTWESVGFTLAYGLGASYRLGDWFVPQLELHGWTRLTGDPGSTSLWLNAGARFELSDYHPVLRLSLPLTDSAAFGAPVQLALGIVQEF